MREICLLDIIHRLTSAFNIQDFETVKGSVETVIDEVFPGPTLV